LRKENPKTNEKSEMAIVNPFKALRPQPQFAPKVASRPYDVLNSLEAKIEARGNPHSFLHITKSEIDLPDKTDIHSQEVYDRARQNLNAFIQRGVLFQEDKACYYIYQLVMNGRSQTGLVGVSAIDDYEKNVIKKHELTRPEKEEDRINHIKTTKAQTGNVFLAYRNVPEIDEVITNWKQTHDPVYDFVADDGVSHAIWVINSDQVNNTLNKLFKDKVPATYIADGHHRAASAAKVRLQVEENYFLTTLFPANQLKILEYNRVVKDLNGLEPAQFIEKLKKYFDVTESTEPVAPSKLHEFGMYLKKKWYKLVSKPNTFSTDPIGVLDVTILSENILDALLGITDQRTDKRIDFIGGIRGLGELEKRVDSGEMAVAFSLFPVSIEQLFNIADSGNVMPPKSTWFEPKLRDGLLTHLTRE
jgi:uncharacterized protein (DUF1015 family)